MFLKHSVGEVEGSIYAKTQLDSSSRFDTTPATVTGRRTDTRRQHTLRQYSVAR